MRIVQLAAELAPLAKVGGMGDVVAGLSHELMQQKHEVEIIIPKYSFIREEMFSSLKLSEKTISCVESKKPCKNRIYHGILHGMKVTLIDPLPPKNYFRRSKIYGYRDDNPRFCYFSKAALEYLLQKGEKIDVLHLHDWHTAMALPLYRDLYTTRGLLIKSFVMTIHNLAYQGVCAGWDFDKVSLDSKKYLKSKLFKDRRAGCANLLKGAINLSDAITAVSPTYANEILSRKNSCGLQSTLLKNRHKLFGILNGLDSIFWNPQKDPFLARKYSAKDPIKAILTAKAENKKMLNLPKNSKPLIGCVSRLVPQKGPKLIKHAILYALRKDAQFILLGSSPIKKIEQEFARLKKNLKKNKNTQLNFNFDNALSHLIYAACDFIIVPSDFEPCGLTQLIAMRYGAIPIVRETGGLADTVFDVDKTKNNKKNGYTFRQLSAKGIDSALNRALECYEKDPKKLQKLILAAMRQDFSWKLPAKAYISIYKQISRKRKTLTLIGVKSLANMSPV